METVEEIIRKIEELRQFLYQLMSEKLISTDTEIVALSQKSRQAAK